VLRAAGCYGVDSIYYTGERYDRAEKYQLDTQTARATIPLTAVQDMRDVIPASASMICVELVEGALLLPQFEHPKSAFYVFGPEDGTIEQALIDRADTVVYVPTTTSMNLAACVNVVLYDRLAKSDLTFANDEFICQVRDTNNNTIVENSGITV